MLIYIRLQTEFMKTFNLSSSTSIPQLIQQYMTYLTYPCSLLGEPHQQYICMYRVYIYVYTCITGNLSNCHCLAKAVNQIAGALFTIHGPGDVSDRLQEFLAVSLPPPPPHPTHKKPTNITGSFKIQYKWLTKNVLHF